MTTTSIGKYRIERVLGRGASGTVYLAYDGFHGRQVALKQLHAHLLTDPGQAQRWRRLLRHEAAQAGRLDHPHIVHLLDVDAEAEQPYLVLEYVPGRALSDHTAADRLLPVDAVIDLAFKCCHALDHALRQGLVHRDIKPANMLLRDDGELKLTDFGAALQLTGDETQLAGLVGSPAYMSPEQIAEQRLTHQSDMFSLAVSVWELLTGRRPFDADNHYATIYRITNAPTPSLRLARPDLPQRLEPVLARALAKRAAERYHHWADFADALMDAQDRIPHAETTQTGESLRFQRLRGLPFFADFPDALLWEALRLATWHWLDAGTVIMEEGSEGDWFQILVEGRVAISRNAVVLSMVEAGVSIGEMSYLQAGQARRTATAVAFTRVLILVIHNAALRRASAALQASFDKAFIRLLVARLAATNQQLAQ